MPSYVICGSCRKSVPMEADEAPKHYICLDCRETEARRRGKKRSRSGSRPSPELPLAAFFLIPPATAFLLTIGLLGLRLLQTSVLVRQAGASSAGGDAGAVPIAEAPEDLTPAKVPPPATDFAGLLAYWPFEDEEPTAKVVDQAQHLNDGQAVGATRVDGIRGQALFLDGRAAHFDYGSHPSLNFPAQGDFTLACWVKTTAPAGVVVSQRSKGDDGADVDLLILGGQFHAHVRKDRSAATVSVATAVRVNDDRWHHAALVRSGKDVTLYVDGKQAGRSTGVDVDGPITTDLRAVGLERRWGPAGFGGIPGTLRAAVDEFCIFGRALSGAEIRSLAGR